MVLADHLVEALRAESVRQRPGRLRFEETGQACLPDADVPLN
jgi:hypothetical protein